MAWTETPAIPSTSEATVTGRRRVETFSTVIVRRDRQPTSSAAPKPIAAGRAATSAAEAAPGSTKPAPCAATAVARSGTAVPTSTPFRAAASSSGRDWATSAAAPPTSAAAALEPLIEA